LLDLARRGEDSIIARATRALSDRFAGEPFTRDEASEVIQLEWLGDRPRLWAELHALDFIDPSDSGPLWRVSSGAGCAAC